MSSLDLPVGWLGSSKARYIYWWFVLWTVGLASTGLSANHEAVDTVF